MQKSTVMFLEPIAGKLVSNRKLKCEVVALIERYNHSEPRVKYVLAHLWLHMLKDSHPTMLKVRVIHRHTNPLNRRKYDDFKHYSQLYRAYSQGESGPPKSRTDQRTEQVSKV